MLSKCLLRQKNKTIYDCFDPSLIRSLPWWWIARWQRAMTFLIVLFWYKRPLPLKAWRPAFRVLWRMTLRLFFPFAISRARPDKKNQIMFVCINCLAFNPIRPGGVLFALPLRVNWLPFFYGWAFQIQYLMIFIKKLFTLPTKVKKKFITNFFQKS